MPYLYSMAGMVHFKDYTMMRGLVMDFNGDDNVYDIKDQWMFGPAAMAGTKAATRANETEAKRADAGVATVRTAPTAKTNATTTARGNGQPPHATHARKDVSDPSLR